MSSSNIVVIEDLPLLPGCWEPPDREVTLANGLRLHHNLCRRHKIRRRVHLLYPQNHEQASDKSLDARSTQVLTSNFHTQEWGASTSYSSRVRTSTRNLILSKSYGMVTFQHTCRVDRNNKQLFLIHPWLLLNSSKGGGGVYRSAS